MSFYLDLNGADRRLPTAPPRRRQVRFLPRSSNVITPSEGRSHHTTSILRLLSDPNYQQPQPRPARTQRRSPPSRGNRPSAPEDIQNWLGDNRRRFHDETPKQPTARNEFISPIELGPALSSSSILSSPLLSTTGTEPPMPPSQPETKTLYTKLHELKDMAQSAREAETLQAYDVGVIATISSMSSYWTSRAIAMATSRAEKQIFLREAQRLTNLIDSAEEYLQISHTALLAKQDAEEDLWEDFFDEVASISGTTGSSSTGTRTEATYASDGPATPPSPAHNHGGGAVGLGISFPGFDHFISNVNSTFYYDMDHHRDGGGSAASDFLGTNGTGTGQNDQVWAGGELGFPTPYADRYSQDANENKADGFGATGFMDDAEIIYHADGVMSDSEDWV